MISRKSRFVETLVHVVYRGNSDLRRTSSAGIKTPKAGPNRDIRMDRTVNGAVNPVVRSIFLSYILALMQLDPYGVGLTEMFVPNFKGSIKESRLFSN